MELVDYVLIGNMFLHNVLIVAFAASPLYMLIVTQLRDQQGAGYDIGLDTYLENLHQRHGRRALYLLAALITTGFFFPLISILFHGGLPDLVPLVWEAAIVKHIGVFSVLGIAVYMKLKVNPGIQTCFEALLASSGDSNLWNEVQTHRGLRTRLYKLQLGFLVIILLMAPILRFMS